MLFSTVVSSVFRTPLRTKLAFNPSDMRRVLNLARGIQIPRALQRMVPGFLRPGAFAIPSRELTQTLQKKLTPGSYETPDPSIVRQLEPLFRASQSTGRSAIHVDKPHKIFRSMYQHLPRLSPSDRRAVKAVTAGHEMDELKYMRQPSTVTLGTGHMSPRVLFQESNRVATLPPENIQAAEFMRRSREFHENKALFEPFGMHYGMQRVSRHAAKRMTESLERRGVKMTSGGTVGSMFEHSQQYDPQRWSRKRKLTLPTGGSWLNKPPRRVTVQEVSFDELPEDVRRRLTSGGQ